MNYEAYLAYEQENGTYNIYRSMKGGEEYCLYDVITDVVESEEKQITDVLGVYVNELSKLSSSETTLEVGDGEFIDTHPTATNVEKEEIISYIPTLTTELVVVARENEFIDAFIPVNTSPTIIGGLLHESKVEIYDGVITTVEETTKDTEPIAVIADDASFNEEILINPVDDRVPGVFEQCHRHMAEKSDELKQKNKAQDWMTVDEITVKVVVDDINSEYRSINIGLPIRVTKTENGDWNYKVYTNKYEAYGGLPKVFTSQLRTKLQPKYEQITETIRRNDFSEEEITQQIQPIADEMLIQLYKNFGEDILFEYIDETMEEKINYVTSN